MRSDALEASDVHGEIASLVRRHANDRGIGELIRDMNRLAAHLRQVDVEHRADQRFFDVVTACAVAGRKDLSAAFDGFRHKISIADRLA